MACFLIVDDEENLRYSLRLILEQEGHRILEAAGYEEALDCIDASPPDVIFADILLSGKSGIELLKEVNNRTQLHCPVVMITGEPSVKTASEAVRLGAYDYVPKPINKDTFLRMANGALRHKELEDQKRRLEVERASLQRFLEAVFASVPDAIIAVDREGLILRTNPQVEEILGIPHMSLLNRDCQDSLGKTCELLGTVVMQTLQTQKPVREYRVENVTTPKGERTLVLNSAPLLNKHIFMGAVLVIRDISHQAGLERELSERRQFQQMVGKSPAIQEIYGLIKDLRDTDTTVLVTGPSGTGKELVAQALHDGGCRAGHALIKVNCSALSENLLESELFGHVRGAFTGAIKDKLGRFQLAHEGTIFLDEIGDISSRIQLKLLRVLQEKEFEPVGDSKTVKVNVRVIAATNQNLREKVATGEFREDLYYRLKVVEIVMPPLRERREDIPLLIDHFVGMFNKQFNKSVKGVSDSARTGLMHYSWPGNIREFKHAIEHGFILCRESMLELEHLPVEVRDVMASALMTGARERSLGSHEIKQALTAAGGNKAKAARALNVSRQTIYRKIREYHL